jgi:hypothetical protein
MKSSKKRKSNKSFPTAVVVAIIGFCGTVIVALIGLWGTNLQINKTLQTTQTAQIVKPISLELNGPICEYKKGDFSESTALLSVVNYNKLQELGVQVGDKVTVTITGNDFSNFAPGLKLGVDPSLGKCVIRMERVIFKGLDSQLVEELNVDLNQRHNYQVTVTVE